MPIITISRGSFNRGKAVAEKLAHKLGYDCISRDEVLESLDGFHLEELKLVRELKDAFSVLDRFPHGKKSYVMAMKAALLRRFKEGNVVYHGLVGHYFVRDISHVLKVRIVADMDRRIADEMKREEISADQARYILKTDDEERRKWSLFVYGIDLQDAELYNLVIRVGHLSEDDAVDIIAHAAELPLFQETDESKAKLADMALSSMVGYALFDFPNAVVTSKGGHVKVVVKAPESQQDEVRNRIEETLLQVDDIVSKTVVVDPYY